MKLYIPGAHVEADIDNDLYKIAIESWMARYFFPKQSFIYERHLFRQMRQESNEKFEKLLIKLWQKSSKCKFSNGNDNKVI